MKKYIQYSSIFLIFVAAFYFLAMAIIDKQTLSTDTNTWGAFGSYFGGITSPILTFLSFIILAKTFEIQQKISTTEDQEKLRQRKLSEIELCIKNLERLEIQLDTLLNKKIDKFNNISMLELFNDPERNIDKNNLDHVKAADSIIVSLVFMSFYISDISNRLKDYYSSSDQFSSLSFKHYWLLKYSSMTKNCLSIVTEGKLSNDQRQCLLNGLGV